MVNYGDIFLLGNHRLMCGDATNKDDLEELITGEKVDLILTDPPYGMKCQDKNGAIGGMYLHEIVDPKRNPYHKMFTTRTYPLIYGDNNQNIAKKHYEIIKNIDCLKIIWGGQYFAHFLPVSGAWIFWDKQTGDNDFSDGELAWVSSGKRIRKYEHLWHGICRKGNYKLNPKPRVHPTQKPVELHIQILEDFSKPNDIVLDCFGGSGTTLIACEQINRRCFMMELSPEYCEIIINRWKLLNPLLNTEEKIN